MNAIRLTLSFLAFLIVAGCGSTNWVKQSGYTDSEAAFNDKYECEMMAQGMVPIGPQQKFERDKTYHTTCSQNGGNTNCNTTEMEWGAGPAEAGAALGRAIRKWKQGNTFKECMRSRGYVPEKEMSN